MEVIRGTMASLAGRKIVSAEQLALNADGSGVHKIFLRFEDGSALFITTPTWTEQRTDGGVTEWMDSDYAKTAQQISEDMR